MTLPVVANRSLLHHRRCIIFFFIFAALTGCFNPTSSISQTEDVFLPSVPNITFFVTVPADTPPDAEIFLDIIDDVTSINLNTTRYKMTLISDNLYSFEIPAQNGALLKYRYALGSTPTTIEYDPRGEQIQFRTFSIQQNGPLVARDMIASWNDSPLNVSLGRMKGVLVDASSGEGISDMLINLNGIQTTTTATGEFLLQNALPGKYLLTLYSKDGRYGPYQQEAIIAPEACTPVNLKLIPHDTVQITLIVTPPKDHNPLAPIRLIGNLNNFSDSAAKYPDGTNLTLSNAADMQPQSDGTYSLTINLPSGIDFHYKYTIGDGFWNAERHSDGQFITRQLIVPNENTIIRETIASWYAGDQKPITIQAKNNGASQPSEQLFIQLNSFTWAEPLPMWQTANGEWQYQIYSPLYLFPSIGYRLCGDAQCDKVIPLDEALILEPARITTDGSHTVIQHTFQSMPSTSN